VFGTLAWCRFAGTTPVSDLLAWLDETEPRIGRDQFFNAYRAWSLAKLGRFDEARAAAALEQALARYERKGNLVMAGRMRDRLSALREALLSEP